MGWLARTAVCVALWLVILFLGHLLGINPSVGEIFLVAIGSAVVISVDQGLK